MRLYYEYKDLQIQASLNKKSIFNCVWINVKYQVDKVYIDGANPSFIKSLKLQIGQEAEADYDKVIARYRSKGFGDDAAPNDMKIIPVNFNREHKSMLGHCKMILENEGGRVAINPNKFDKLITALRTVVDNDGTVALLLSQLIYN